MDSLLAGTLILPWKGHCAGYDVQRRRAVETFRGSRKPFRDQAKTVRLPAGITVRLQPGILFVFTRNRFRVHPGIPFALPRNPHMKEIFSSRSTRNRTRSRWRRRQPNSVLRRRISNWQNDNLRAPQICRRVMLEPLRTLTSGPAISEQRKLR
jgi:hypothetical protein